MKKFEANPLHGYNDDEIGKAIAYVNSIHHAMRTGEYVEGTRNNMAVDLCCACYVLGIDVNAMAKEALPTTSAYLDFNRRRETIAPYLVSWDCVGGVFGYMLTDLDDYSGKDDVVEIR